MPTSDHDDRATQGPDEPDAEWSGAASDASPGEEPLPRQETDDDAEPEADDEDPRSEHEFDDEPEASDTDEPESDPVINAPRTTKAQSGPAVKMFTPPPYPTGGPMILQQPPAPVFPWWRPPQSPAPAKVIWVGVATGLGAAALTPQTIGIGWLLAGLVGLGAFVYYVKRPTAAQAVWLAAAIALLGIGAIRDADWLFPLCVMASVLCGAMALVNGRSVLSVAFSAIAIPLAALRSVPWVARGLANARPRNVRSVISVGVSLLLLMVFGSLLASADATFNEFMNRLTPSIDPDKASWWIFMFVVAGFGAFGACYLVTSPAQIKDEGARKPGTLRPKDYALPVGVLVVLFTGFLATQVAVLFGGNDYVQRTAGVTFAEYARSGFWQLLWVTVLTLAVIGVVARWSAKETVRDQMWLRGLLGALAVLTLVIVTSALSRMWFYQEAYGFTVLRLLVGACELWLGLVYLLVIAAGVQLRAAWLPRAVVGTGTAFFLALAVLNPEAIVAEHNVTRWKETGKIDTYYLQQLSGDAVPAIYELPEPLRSCAIWSPRLMPVHDEDFRDWNLSREKARKLLADNPLMNSCQEDRPNR
ncbi:DUF4153 domain-containing protein [Lentzea tibetensis]|nr:DUF4173 domain-containing protein [Lentzea tibetensis]